jgi:hypothetical protein
MGALTRLSAREEEVEVNVVADQTNEVEVVVIVEAVVGKLSANCAL